MTRTYVCYLNIIPAESQEDNCSGNKDIQLKLVEPMTLAGRRERLPTKIACE